jgi:HAD superfamily hydrolase (TIGR01458 family)
LTRLSGVSTVLVDLEGTVFQSGVLLPGAAEALAAISRAGLARRFVTNATSRPRSVLVKELAAMGLAVEPESVVTAPRAAAAILRARGWTRCHFLLRPALIEDFDGIEAVEAGVHADAVVLGDLGDGMTYARLNRAFRMLLDGAELVALARNRYWRGEDGLMLDTGAFAAALEAASGKIATLAGKPAPAFFAAVLSSAGASPQTAIVVGDDLESDVGGAQQAGMRGVLVRTGKYRKGDLERSKTEPDAVVDSLAQLPGLLGIPV